MKHNIKYGVVAALTMAAFVAPNVGAITAATEDAIDGTNCVVVFTDSTKKTVKDFYYDYTTDNGTTFIGGIQAGVAGGTDKVTVSGAATEIPVSTFNSIVGDIAKACEVRYKQTSKLADLQKQIGTYNGTAFTITAATFYKESSTFKADETIAAVATSANVAFTKDVFVTKGDIITAYNNLKTALKDYEKQLADANSDLAANKSGAQAALDKLTKSKEVYDKISSIGSALAAEEKSLQQQTKDAYKVVNDNDNKKIIANAIEDANLALLKANVAATEKDMNEKKAAASAVLAKTDAAEAKVTETAKAYNEATKAADTYLKERGITDGESTKLATDAEKEAYKKLNDAKTAAKDAYDDAKTAQTRVTTALTTEEAKLKQDYTDAVTAHTAAKTAYNTAADSATQDKNKTHIEAITGEDETKSIASATVSGVSRAYTYTGKAIAPVVTIKASDGTTLVKDVDYTVSYASNTKVGTATITITGKGDYSGSVTKSFYIDPAKSSIKKVAVAAKKMTVTVKKGTKATGIQIGYRVKGTSKWSYTKTTSTSKTIKSLKKGKKYQVVVRSYTTKSGKVTNYSGWSATKTTAKIK